jgi:aspartyl/glutamyl-tRNA(Asn/Gln) amidotransferase C subunit
MNPATRLSFEPCLRTPDDSASASEPSLSADYVQRIAALSKLRLAPDQLDSARRDLSAIVTYFERLKELNLKDIDPLVHVGDSTNRLDDDTPGETLPLSALLAMAPDSHAPFVKVPKVLGDGAGA